MMRAFGAGIAYFGLVFALGMVLGPIRILLIEPRLGPVSAVLVELPVMLAASWMACGWLLRRLAVGDGMSGRIVMGTVAFLLLMSAELALSLFLGVSFGRHFAAYRDPAPMLGLTGQLAFAAFPLLRR